MIRLNYALGLWIIMEWEW